MSERPSKGIGKRVVKYRKLAGISARELSERIGGELSRGVIANIESGRKTDVTIDQLVALAWALDVPPVVLALPVDEPLKFVQMFQGPKVAQAIRSSSAVSWFNADANASRFNSPAGPGTVLAQALLKAINEYEWADAAARMAKIRLAEGKIDQVRFDEDQAFLEKTAAALRSLGADLTVFKIDE